MVGDGIAEVVSCCDEKAEQLVICLQKIFYSLLKNDETPVLYPVLIVVANTPVDMNMNGLQVPGDERLIILLNYNLFFSNTLRLNDFSRRTGSGICRTSELSLGRKQN